MIEATRRSDFPERAGGELQTAILHRLLEQGLGIVHDRHFVAIASVHGDVADQEAPLALDLLRAEDGGDTRELGQGNLRA